MHKQLRCKVGFCTISQLYVLTISEKNKNQLDNKKILGNAEKKEPSIQKEEENKEDDLEEKSLSKQQLLEKNHQKPEKDLISFYFDPDHIDGLENCLESFCSSCTFQGRKQHSFIQNFKGNLNKSKSLKDFLKPYKFLSSLENEQDPLNKLDELFKEINDQHDLKIENNSKSNISNKTYTIISESTRTKSLRFSDKINGKVIEKNLKQSLILDKNHPYSRLEIYEDDSLKYAVRFFFFVKDPLIKETTIKRINEKYTEYSKQDLKHAHLLTYPYRLLRLGKKKLPMYSDICIVSEYCDLNIEKYIAINNITPAQSKTFITQLIDAIWYLKSSVKLNEPYKHANIKPSNILFKNGEIKLDYLNFNDFFNGSDSIYFAPESRYEIAENYEKCDIWSLGAIYFYLLTKKPPFKEGDENIKFSNDNFDLEFDSSIDQNTQDLIRRMLCFDEKNRIDWAELRKAFENSAKESENNEFSFPSNKADPTKSLEFPTEEVKSNNIDNSSQEEEPWIMNLEDKLLRESINNLEKLLDFLSETIHLINSEWGYLEIKPKDVIIITLFLRKIAIVQIIDLWDKVSERNNEDYWNNLIINLERFILYHPIEIKELIKEYLPLSKIRLMDLLNDKLPTYDDIKLLFQNSMLSFVDLLIKAKNKLNDFGVDPQRKLKIDFLYNCIGILLKMPKLFKEPNNLILHFDEYKNKLAPEYSFKSPFSSHDTDLRSRTF